MRLGRAQPPTELPESRELGDNLFARRLTSGEGFDTADLKKAKILLGGLA